MGTILRIKPVFKETIWGGRKLKDEFGYNIPSDKTGECWSISAHKNGDCEIENKEYEGYTLSGLYNDHRELFGDIKDNEFPLLIKIIDANNDLSVQVHPDNMYALKNENSLGKAECWYVLSADKNADMVMGHNAKTKEELIKLINNNDYSTLLNKFKVKSGDFFYIAPGTIHAICTGTLIYEAQQSSDITYRVYDYDRLDDKGAKRELHVEKSIDVTTVPYVPNKGLQVTDTKNDVFPLIKNEYFQVSKINVEGSMVIENKKPFLLLTAIDGQGTINGNIVKKGDNFIVCSDTSYVELTGNVTIMCCSL